MIPPSIARPALRRALACAGALAGTLAAAQAAAQAAAPVAPVAPAGTRPTGAAAASPVVEAPTLDPYAPAPPRVLPPAAPEAPVWYGWQTLTADGAALVVGVGMTGASAAAGEGSTALATAFIGSGLLLVAAPVVHWGHGHVARGFLDLGLRVAGPLLGLLLGVGGDALCSSARSTSVDSCPALVGVGAVAGMGAAVALDAAWLAYEPPAHPGQANAWQLRPVLSSGPHHGALSLAGTF
jgi:hypothetical protein